MIRVLPLSGESQDYTDLEDAVSFIESVEEDRNSGPVVRYEVQIRYDNGDEITGEFSGTDNAISFLEVTVAARSSPDQFE